MKLIPDLLSKYVEQHTTEASEVLQKLDRDTSANVLRPNMLSGHVQGRLLSFLSKMIRPHRILEIGTYTGYSAICLAEGLVKDGKLTTIDINEELESFVRKYFKEAGMEDQIKYIIGNALEIIPTLEEQYDLIFIDADKSNYYKYYELCMDKLKVGGFILADNVLWKGRVVEEQERGRDLAAIKLFNRKIQEDPRVENIILAIRDGIMLVRKKH